MVREKGSLIVAAAAGCPFDGATYDMVKRASLVAEQTVVSDLLCKHVFESIAALRRKPGLLNEAGCVEFVDGTVRTALRSEYLDQHIVAELPADDRSDP